MPNGDPKHTRYVFAPQEDGISIPKECIHTWTRQQLSENEDAKFTWAEHVALDLPLLYVTSQTFQL